MIDNCQSKSWIRQNIPVNQCDFYYHFQPQHFGNVNHACPVVKITFTIEEFRGKTATVYLYLELSEKEKLNFRKHRTLGFFDNLFLKK